eukprot:3071395-Heterocapsa_arctica.AAC.1
MATISPLCGAQSLDCCPGRKYMNSWCVASGTSALSMMILRTAAVVLDCGKPVDCTELHTPTE